MQGLCTDSIALVNPGAQRSTAGSFVNLQIKADDTRGAALAYRASGLPSGLSIGSSTGKISGRSRHVGTATVTVTTSDPAGTTARISFPWTIQTNPTLSNVSLTQVGSARPRLSFMLAAGRAAPPLVAVTVALPRGLSFAHSRSTVMVTAAGNQSLSFIASLQHGTLVLKLRRTAPVLHVTISYPRIKASGGLAGQVSARRASPVTLTIRATDAFKLTTKLTARVRATT
jgi:hypothetical protein